MGIALLFPKEGIELGNKAVLKFHWSFQNLFDKEIQYADIAEIINEHQSLIKEDSLLATKVEQFTDTIRVNAKVLRSRIQTIEYPSGDSTLLNSFFKKLDNSGNKKLRILHYGDSQIEGDRISGFLRHLFQGEFGGSGPGLMPAIPAHAETSSIVHSASGNWLGHSVYYKKDTILPHTKFGILGGFSRFTSYKDDSLNQNKTIQKATIEFNRSGLAYSSVNKFTECRIFYGHCNEAVIVKGYVNDSLIWFEELDTTQRTKKIQWDFAFIPKDFKIEFEGTKSPDIYGIALDAKNGVALDNLPFRGSSGTDFSKLDRQQMKTIASYLNTGLIILEFGVNVVSHQVKSYLYYERAMTRQLKYLQSVFPNTPILVIGLSDISQRKGNYYQSFPNVELINQAQRNAARNANCVFWDLYKAMGGKNSMPSWVFAEPALAGKDFIHFTRKGGHVVAQMLYNALMQDYQEYQLNTDSVAMAIK
jgi:hypothetical protein